MASKSKLLGDLLDANGDVLLTNLDNISVTPASVSDQSNTSTGAFDIPSGTTAQRPVSPNAGYIRYNTTIDSQEVYSGTGWITLSPAPILDSISPSAIPESSSSFDITLTGSNFSAGQTVKAVGQDSSEITASSVSVNSSTEMVATFDGTSFSDAQEDYDIVVISGGVSSQLDDALSVNASPVWTTSANSDIIDETTSSDVSATVVATDPESGSITYSVTTNTLPSGLSLNGSTGAITGTLPSVGSDTTTNIGITASDGTNGVERTFNIINRALPYSTTSLSFNLRGVDQTSLNSGGDTINQGDSLVLHSSGLSGFTADMDTGAVAYNYLSSQGGKDSFYFNGVDMIHIDPDGASTANTAFNNAASQSTAVWFYWPNDNSRQVLIARWTPSPILYHWNCIVDPGRNFHYNSSGVIDGAGGNITGGPFFSTGQWTLHHKVYNVSDGIFRWYINGSEVVTANVGTDSGAGLTGYTDNTTPYSIGSRTDFSESFTGWISEARHYHRALTASEILDEWNATKADFGLS